MRTAISISEPIFEAAEQLARQLGISRSELYTTAIATFIKAHRAEHITEQLNQLYVAEDSSLAQVVEQLQAISIQQNEAN